MTSRIEVGFKKDIKDALGDSTRKRIVEDLHINVESVRTLDVYTIDADISNEQVKILGEELFADPVIQEYSPKPIAKDFSWLIEVGFKPGVTDNVGTTAKKASEDILKTTIKGVYFSRQYLIKGNITKEDAEKIAGGLLANTLIERWVIINGNDWDQQNGVHLPLPVVKGKHKPSVMELDLNTSDEKLKELSTQRLLALSQREMIALKEYFNEQETRTQRKDLGLTLPTDVEIEVLA
ncbi:MAG: phosphoribosylformylglycinamidine synthase subunit PurS, partial [Candidatus Methanoperedens sp.]|nr:phosphoribosylformylglycinamidine synthase subunit PurS [Candidatus Methanoperedens sp.]